MQSERQLDGRSSSMRKKAVLSVIGLAVAVAMTLPASAVAKPTMFDRFEARQTCIGERGVGDPIKRQEFRLLWGRKPMRKCVRFNARLIAMERVAEVPLIKAECRLLARTEPEFRLDYPGGVKMCIRMEMMP
jgi:hypothetical protein